MDRKKQLEAYVRAGMGNAAIAEALGISEPRVGHLVKRYGLTGLRRPGARRKTETVHIPSPEKEGSTLVMVYPDGTSVELTGTIEVMPRDGKWYVEFREE